MHLKTFEKVNVIWALATKMIRFKTGMLPELVNEIYYSVKRAYSNFILRGNSIDTGRK